MLRLRPDLNPRITKSRLGIILRKCPDIFGMDQSLPPIFLFPQKKRPPVSHFNQSHIVSGCGGYVLHCGDIVFDCCGIVLDWSGIVFGYCGGVFGCCGVVFVYCGIGFGCCGFVFSFFKSFLWSLDIVSVQFSHNHWEFLLSTELLRISTELLIDSTDMLIVYRF